MIVRNSRELGHLVRDYRTRRGLTQARLAAQVGASRKWVVELEAGKRTVDLSLVLRTLNVLGVELDARDRSERSAGRDHYVNAIVDAARGERS